MADTTILSVRLPDELAKRLGQLAGATDRSKSYLASQAIEEFVTLQEWQIDAIGEGIEAADNGDLASHDKAVNILDGWGR